MNIPSVVAIAGSCGTRDNFNTRFNPGYKEFFSCDLAANQASMIAMMSPPVEPVFEPLGEMSDYDHWNVTSDLNREFLTLVAELKPEYLILDFFGDVHFGVLRLADGRYVTNNRWKLHRTDLYRDLAQSEGFTKLTIFDDTEEYLGLWREAMDRFAAHIATHCPDTTVVVHRGYNTNLTTAPGKPRPIPLRQFKPLSRLDVPRANELWGQLDDYCIDTFGWASIDLRAEHYTSYAEHPWGVFYVHYTPDYYHRFLAELHKIHLGRGGNSEQLSRIESIEAAAREHGERQVALRESALAGQRDRIERQRIRIDELEGLLPRGWRSRAASARSVIGTKLRSRKETDKTP